MPKEMLKVAHIGSGMTDNLGQLPAWKNLSEDVEVVGVADIICCTEGQGARSV